MTRNSPKRIFSLKGLSLLSIAVLASCGGSFTKMRDDIDRLEKSVSDMRAFQAEHTTQISEMRSELRAITGRLDELNYSQSNRIGTDLSALKNDLTTLKRRVPPPPIVPASVLDADEVMAASLPPEISKLMGDALQEIRGGNFANAIPMLRSALDASYGRDWSAMILFWSGVAFDGMLDNRNALASYNEINSRYPKHDKAPLALSRQASVFMRLGDKQSAKLTLKKLISDYPKSSEVAQAKERLKGL